MYVAVRNAPGETWQALRDTRYAWLVPSLALLVLAFLVRAVRWWWLFAPERRPPLLTVVKALYVGYLANNLLPARAGEAARVVALNRAAQTPLAEVTATALIERTFDVLSLVLLLFASVPWLPPVAWLRGAAFLGGVVLVGIGVVAVAVAVWHDRPLQPLARALGRLPFVPPGYVDRAPGEFVLGLAGLLRPRVALGAFAWTTASWMLLGISYWCAMLAFDLGLSPLAGELVVIGIGLALILPSSPAAIGVFEAATVVVVGAYGIEDSTALSYALVLHLLNVVPFLVVPLPLLAVRRVRRNRNSL